MTHSHDEKQADEAANIQYHSADEQDAAENKLAVDITSDRQRRVNGITLSRSGTGWMATHTGPHAADIIRLFCTVTIPTAFTPQADPQMVLREIQANNPDALVVLA